MILTNAHYPPLDYSHLFPDLIRFHMRRNPYFPMFLYTDESALTGISFLEFGRAAHRVAHALRPSRQGPDGEVVMVIANTDTILHHAVVAGLSVAGWIPFPVSPRNSAAAVVDMMKKSNCSRIVTLDHAHRPLIDGIRHEMQGAEPIIYELPTLCYTFPKLGRETADDAFVYYPPSKNRPDLDTPAIFVHSSGSTGFPKPIAHSHRIQIQWLAHPSFRQYAGLPPPRHFGAMALPAFHIFGIAIGLYAPISCLVTSSVFPPCTHTDHLARPVIPTSDNIIRHLRQTKSNVFMTVPTFLEQMATSDEAIDVLKKMDNVTCGGGFLPVDVGQKLWAAGVQLVIGYGGTEFGVPVATTSREDIADGDWMWVRFSDSENIRWAAQGNDTYELHILSTEHHQMAVENLPDVKGYATSDIFMKHPSKNAWKIVGRTDDVIVLVSGEKTVPVPMEGIIASSPVVQGVLMFGRNRNQVGVLIEPRPEHAIDVNDEKAVTEFRNQIWPTIEEANRQSPAFSRIFKEMILVTDKNKPMLRAPKGTVQRKATLNAHEAEINTLYNAIEASSEAPDTLAEPSAWTTGAVEEWLLAHAGIINPNRCSIDPHTDLFAQGFDSLSATYLRNRIFGALQRSSDEETKNAAARVLPNIIFDNPTVRQLSTHLTSIINGDCARPGMDFIEQHKQTINAMISKYSAGLSGPADGVLPSSLLIEPAVVLLTGSTGSLGSFLLSQLLKSHGVQRVFAFNRPSSTKFMAERQKAAFRDRGLPLELLELNKLVYVEADASLRKCGLSSAQYEQIQNSVTLIIHNAWRLDFNLTISSFEDSIRASRNLIDLALESPQKKNIRFLFTSSVASGQGWDNSKGGFPEEVQLDPSVAVGSGYGEGKYVCERIIAKSGLRATSLRIGQIAGGHGGFWATTDWFPILVKSSVTLGVLPEAASAVSWLCVEEAVSAILETAFSKEAPPSALNIVNPRSARWADIIAFVQRAIIRRKGLAGEGALPIVPFGEWFRLLEGKAENASADDLVKIPAIKLLEFFRTLSRADEATRSRDAGKMTEAGGLTNFRTAKAQEVSATMTNMQAIGEMEADAWVEYWISRGTL